MRTSRLDLVDLADEWVDVAADPAASQKMADIKAHLAEMYFARSGATVPGSVIYYRITGPTVHIEFSHQGGGPGGPDATGAQAGGVNHIHTVYRDPTNEYGRGIGQ